MLKVKVDKPESGEDETKEPTKKTIDHIKEAVGNAVVVWTSYKHYHWNLAGPRFRDLHKLFDDFAGEVYDTIDDLAERVRMLDDFPPSSLAEFSKVATVTPGKAEEPDDMIYEALQTAEHVIECMKEGAEAAQEEDDFGSVDMFSKFVQIYEKQAWFLRQLLTPEG